MAFKDPTKAKEYARKYGEANKDRIAKKSRDWYLANREKCCARSRLRHRQNTHDPAHRDKRYAAKIKFKYGITIEQYKQLFELQQGNCAICGEPEKAVDSRHGKLSRLAVDHDHATGAVRGLLCRNCNRAIGALRDNPQILQRAIAYLEGSK